ncbi:CheY-like chemotaxis protein [Phyllobacterium trifolii]|uniref:CheY-like chemotaxis protein n=1 Tax=Phyllobacterium trifolii TaxID=300193 RepID=A0A839UFX0_9HYPH|nr:response regulator [Phyllobacterium trifolii]MBB3147740.1 CheY-like chemotaxis protein [Phyllobacterium trifolii]
MRVLLVEDKIDFAKIIEAKLNAIPDCEVRWAKSRDSAEATLREEDFDLIIIDRKIPSADGMLDDNAEHGLRVFHVAIEVCEGTPIWFLTGTEDADFPTEINNNHGRREDIHGANSLEPLRMVFWKRQLDEALKRAKDFADEQARLSAIAITNPGAINLSRAEIKNLRIFSRLFGATSLDVTSLGGGLSKARVVKVVARNAAGAPVHTAVAKIGDLAAVRDEHRRYAGEITKLQPGGYPPLTVKIDAGSGAVGGVYYSVVGTEVTSLFDKIASGDPAVRDVPSTIQQIQRPWQEASSVEQVSVGQIRRRFLPDTKLPDIEAELQGIDITAVEAIVVDAARCSQHNDMHALNVLFDNQARGMVIDFNDAGASFAATDPITLELSLIFHKDYAILGTLWPTADQMALWSDVESYVQDCAFADFIRACRKWALEVAGSPEEVIATSYAYGLRQLKYPDTRKELARALIRAAISSLIK